MPVHIGACNLKRTVFLAVLPQISQWSKQFPLSAHDFCLQEKNWVELIPSLVQGITDVDAIAQKFFVLKQTKGKSEGRVFQSGEVTVNLELPFGKYQEVLEHIESVANTLPVSLPFW